MLGRVPATRHNLPLVFADRQFAAITEALVGFRQRLHILTEQSERGLIHMQLIVGKTGFRIEAHAFFRRAAPGVSDENAAHHVFIARHPKVDIKMPGQESSAADVVRVHVCCDDAGCGVALHGISEDGLPKIDRLGRADARVDYRPLLRIS